MPQGFQIGPLFIHFYGIIIMLGALGAAFLTDYRAKRSGENPDTVWDMLPWLLIAGIVGARVWHIITPPASMVAQGITFQYYLTHPLDAIAIWRGGLGIPGAVMGGAIALVIYCRKYRLSVVKWLDLIAPGLVMAQGIGRWGNFFNQELYGSPTNLPWAISIAPQFRLPGYENIQYYHPLFLYESLWDLIAAGILLWIGMRLASRLRKGDIFLGYLILYPTMRFFLEFLRLDPSPVAGLNVNQTLMAVIALSATGVLIYRHFIQKRPLEIESPVINSEWVEGSEVSEAAVEEDQEEENQPEENAPVDEQPVQDNGEEAS